MSGKVKRRIPQRRGVRNFVLMIMFRTMCCLYLNMIFCEHAESWKSYFIYIPESGENSLLARSMCVAIPAFPTLALDFFQLPALISFRNGRELPWPFFLLQFFHNGKLWKKIHIFLFVMGWSYQHRFTHADFSQVGAA